jgi:hypothetical protein
MPTGEDSPALCTDAGLSSTGTAVLVAEATYGDPSTDPLSVLAVAAGAAARLSAHASAIVNLRAAIGVPFPLSSGVRAACDDRVSARPLEGEWTNGARLFSR